MGFRLRFLVGSCFVLLVIYGFHKAEGDPPKHLALPEIEMEPVPHIGSDGTEELEKSPAFRAIRAAAEGKMPSHPTNDPILGDVIQAIAERHRELGIDLNVHPADGELESVSPKALEIAPQSQSQLTNPALNARAAEQLLKASRLLEKNMKKRGETPESSRMDLVNRMRAEAVKLLSE